MDDSPPPPLKLTLKPLNGIRGFAALFIVIGHIITFWVPTFAEIAAGARRYAVDLDILSAVSLFFVISGFTMVVVYDKERGDRVAPLGEWKERKEFFVKRVARIAPVYYLALVVGLGQLIVYGTALDFYTIPVTLLMLQSLTYYGNGWSGPLWTVSAFVLQYLLFVFILQRMRTHQNRTHLYIIGICFILSVLIIVLWIQFLGGWGIMFVHYFGIFRLPQFVIGMSFAFVGRRVRLSRPVLWAEIVTVLLILNQVASAFNAFPWYNFYMEFALPPVHGFWLMCLSQAAGKGPTSWALNTRIARFLGEISYSLYCLHWPVLNWVCWAFAGDMNGVPVDRQNGQWKFFHTSAMPVLIIIPVAVATLVHNILEKPARATIRKKAVSVPTAPDPETGSPSDRTTLAEKGGGVVQVKQLNGVDNDVTSNIVEPESANVNSAGE